MTQTSKAYAIALFSLAVESGMQEETIQALDAIDALVKANPEYVSFLASPAIPRAERIQALEKAFAGMPETVVHFMDVLVSRGEIHALGEYIEEYRRLDALSRKTCRARVVSAVPLTDAEKHSLQKKLEARSGKDVELECSIDKSLLGGVVVEMDGVIIDGSLKKKLAEIKDVMNR